MLDYLFNPYYIFRLILCHFLPYLMLEDFQCTLLMIFTAVSAMHLNFYQEFISYFDPTDLSLRIIVIAGGLVPLIVVSCIVIASVAIYRKRKKEQRRANRPNTCSVSQYTMNVF